MDADIRPPSSKELFIASIIFIVASSVLVIPGGINMAIYWNSPLDDTCENYIDDIPLGTYVPCSNELIGAQIVFSIGLVCGSFAVLLALAGVYRRRREG